MAEYRYYRVDKDGHVQGPSKVFEQENDAAAMARAKELVDGYDIEVWQLKRLIGKATGPHSE